MTKFSNLTIDYRQMLGVTIQDRVQLAKSQNANEIFGNMTPTEIAKLFPTYYQKNIPALSGFTGATTGVGSGFSAGGQRGGAGGSGSSGSSAGSTGSSKVNSVTPLNVMQAIALEASMSSPGKDARVAGTVGLKKGRQENMKAVYDAYVSAGMSHKQALAFTAEVGRENGYNPDLMFGTHKDLNGETNIGMISMQKDRRTKLKDFLAAEGLLDANGNMIPGQATLNAQARYQVMEIKENYPETAEKFLANPDIDPEEAAVVLGDDYIRWARKGNLRIGFTPEEAARHDAGRRQNYKEAQELTEGFQKYSDYEQENLIKAQEEGTAEPVLQITPENINSVSGLDPRIVNYIDSLDEAERTQFYNDLNKIKDVNRINQVAKSGLDRINYTPQGTATNVADAVNQDPIAFWQERNPNGANVEDIDYESLKTAMMAAIKMEADHAAKGTPKKVEFYGPGAGVRNDPSLEGSKHGPNYKEAIDFAIYDVDPETGQKMKNQSGAYGNYSNKPNHGGVDADGFALYHELKQNQELARIHMAANEGNMDYANWGVRDGMLFSDVEWDAMHSDRSAGVNRETGISNHTSPIGRGSVAEGLSLSAIQQLGIDPNSAAGQKLMTGVSERFGNTPEALAESARQAYAKPAVEINPHITTLPDGQLSDTGQENMILASPDPATANSAPVTTETAPTAETSPTAEPAPPPPETPADVPKLAQGGFIQKKDDLEVNDTKTGETVAMINEGEVKSGGIVENGSGLQIQSNEKVNAAELASKYEEDTEDAPAPTPQAAQQETVQQQGKMTSPVSDSQSHQNISHIPYQSTMDLVHNSLLRAYDIDRRRTGYGNIQ